MRKYVKLKENEFYKLCFQLGFIGVIIPQKMNVELHNLFHRGEGAKVRYLNYAATANNIKAMIYCKTVRVQSHIDLCNASY